MIVRPEEMGYIHQSSKDGNGFSLIQTVPGVSRVDVVPQHNLTQSR